MSSTWTNRAGRAWPILPSVVRVTRSSPMKTRFFCYNKDRKGEEAIPYVIPPSTLLIESPAAVVETSVESHGNRAVAEAFVEFLVSDEGQRIFAEYGFRPVKTGVAPPEGAGALPTKLFTMADLGGWAKLEQELYGSKGLWTSIFTAAASAKALNR